VFAALALSHSFFCRASICEALLHHLHVEIVREQRWRARRTDRPGSSLRSAIAANRASYRPIRLTRSSRDLTIPEICDFARFRATPLDRRKPEVSRAKPSQPPYRPGSWSTSSKRPGRKFLSNQFGLTNLGVDRPDRESGPAAAASAEPSHACGKPEADPYSVKPIWFGPGRLEAAIQQGGAPVRSSEAGAAR
jgi:hypothetical protein